MSQPYGQQPPGNFNQGPGYGAPMPQAPAEYSAGPVARPGGVTAASVLGFVQAGLTVISALILMIGLAAISDVAGADDTINGVNVGDVVSELWITTIISIIAAGVLIWASVKLLGGKAGNLFLIATGLQILLAIYWLIRGFGIVPILLAVMPIIALVLSLGGAAKQYAASKAGH
jgi:hypothetical protein